MQVALVFFALLSLICTGCTSWTWTYTPNPPTDRSPLLLNSVAVMPFQDARADVEYNKKPLALIPFVIHGEAAVEKWEKFVNTPFTPTEELAKALAAELHNKRYFTRAVFSNDGQGAELILHGKLVSTKAAEDMYTYGLSLVGMYLALLSIPTVYWTWDLALEFELEEPLTRTTLWQQTYSTKRELSFRFWNTMFLSDDEGPPGWFQPMVKELMLKALVDLEGALKGMTTAFAEVPRVQ